MKNHFQAQQWRHVFTVSLTAVTNTHVACYENTLQWKKENNNVWYLSNIFKPLFNLRRQKGVMSRANKGQEQMSESISSMTNRLVDMELDFSLLHFY